MIFKDRADAGRKLALQLQKYQQNNPIILCLPRGGVVVGYEVAKALDCDLDVIVARKIGAPSNLEFGIGAIAEGDVVIFDEPTIKLMGLSKEEIDKIVKTEKKEMERRVKLYRKGESLRPLYDRTVIVVDDGMATGVTAEAAIKSILKHKPSQLIYAAPVCAYDSAEILKVKVDALFCLSTPHEMGAIGYYYQDFEQVSDDEVIDLLKAN